MTGDEGTAGVALTPEQMEAIRRSMLRAGIALKYHKPEMSLSAYGTAGRAILNQLDAEGFYDELNAGAGFNITGVSSVRSYDVAIMTARAMRIMQFDVRVINLTGLLSYLVTSPDELDDLRFADMDSMRGLMITRFCEPMDSLPFKRPEFYKMENYLCALMEEGISVSVQYSGKLQKSGWWSDYFVDRLVTANTEIVCT